MGAYDKQLRTRTYRARESSNYYRTDRDQGVCARIKTPPSLFARDSHERRTEVRKSASSSRRNCAITKRDESRPTRNIAIPVLATFRIMRRRVRGAVEEGIDQGRQTNGRRGSHPRYCPPACTKLEQPPLLFSPPSSRPRRNARAKRTTARHEISVPPRHMAIHKAALNTGLNHPAENGAVIYGPPPWILPRRSPLKILRLAESEELFRDRESSRCGRRINRDFYVISKCGFTFLL